MILQLNPPIPVDTPKGTAQATFLIDYSAEHDLYWVCFIDETHECWTFGNRDIRAQTNVTLGRPPLNNPFKKGAYGAPPVAAGPAPIASVSATV